MVTSSLLVLLAAAQALAQQTAWGQCGGNGWSGATTCVSGYTCSKINDFYFQCVPGSASTTSASTTTARTSTTTSLVTSSTSTRTTTTTSRVSSTSSAPPTSGTGNPGTGTWAAAYTKARAALAKLNNNDKVKIVTGVGWMNGPCVGNTGAVSSIGYPSLCLQDGPLSLRYVKGVTVFPAGVHVASTWDTSLIYARGNAMGSEAKGVGVNVQLAPVAGALGKIPNGGRNWEVGSTSPGGKLPYTIAKQASDYGTAVVSGNDDYPEGLYIDYRHFDKAGIAPRYEFGFGLSYTTFDYSSLTTSYTDKTAGSTSPGPGGVVGLFDTVATVTAKITNNGTVTGAEVAQLYIGLPSSAPASPPKQLRGFQKVSLSSGTSKTVTFDIRRKDLSYWDVGSQAWKVPSGAFSVYVGASSRDIRLTGSF